MNAFLGEVSTQGDVLKQCLDMYLKEKNQYLEEVIKEFKEKKFKKVLFVGMGSSFYAPYAVVDYLTNRNIPSLVLNGYEASRYQFGHVTPDTLVIAISQSGKSKEVIELVKKAKEITTVVGIYNKQGSLLEKESDYKLLIYAGEEKYISNKSYLCTLAVLNILAASLTEELDQYFIKQLYQSADWITDFLKAIEANTNKIYDFTKDGESYDFIANGPSMATAMQAGLIYREGPKVTTSAINCADYAHGWDKSVKPGYVGIMLAPYYKESSVEKRMVETIINMGGKVVLVTGADVEANKQMLAIKHPVLEERILPMLQIIPCDTLMGWMLGKNWTR